MAPAIIIQAQIIEHLPPTYLEQTDQTLSQLLGQLHKTDSVSDHLLSCQVAVQKLQAAKVV